MNSTFNFTGAQLPNPFPGEYRIVRKLGEGKFGVVWLADDLALNVPVALKTVRPPQKNAQTDLALDLLRSEAELAACVRHPNVVQVRAWRSTDGVNIEHFMVLDYVPGRTLAEVLAGGPLPWERAVRYAADVGEALQAVHQRKVIHRDVKPANILLDETTDEARLTDFGVSTRLDGAPGSIAGTLPYMAPEAFDGAAGPPLDVYALAATTYQLVTGRHPFAASADGKHRDDVRRGLPAPDVALGGVPLSVEQLIRDGLRYDPSSRPSLSQFVTALRGALNRALVDSVVLPEPGTVIGPVRIVLDRFDGRAYQEVATSFHVPAPQRATRDMKKVPPAPRTAEVRTGDRVRVRANLQKDGYLVVFNVGPTGNLNLLYPDDPSAPQKPLTGGRTVDVCEVDFEPPVGTERVFAFWSRNPLPLTPKDLMSLTEDPAANVTSAYRATRDMKKVKSALQSLPVGEWHATGVELDHQSQ